MARFVTRTLRERGYEPVLAHYEPYSISPYLSVPSFRLLQRRVGSEVRHALDGCETHAMGAGLPEREFTHYLCTARWKRVMDSCSFHLAVAGNALACLPYPQTGRPFLSWIASGWHMDRKDRVLEKLLLRSGSVLAFSHYTPRAA